MCKTELLCALEEEGPERSISASYYLALSRVKLKRVKLASARPQGPLHLPSCPSTDSGPAFTFSFFSGLLPLGPSRPFLFESFFLPFDLLPEGSVLEKELNLSGCPWVIYQLGLPTVVPRSDRVSVAETRAVGVGHKGTAHSSMGSLWDLDFKVTY